MHGHGSVYHDAAPSLGAALAFAWLVGLISPFCPEVIQLPIPALIGAFSYYSRSSTLTLTF